MRSGLGRGAGRWPDTLDTWRAAADAGPVSVPPDDDQDSPIAIPLGLRPGLGTGTWAIAVGLIVVVVLGGLGRLVPSPAAREPAATATVVPTLTADVQLVSPFRDVLYRRTTEVAVRGSAPPGTEEVHVAVINGVESIGETRLVVDATGRFKGLVSIIPPRTKSDTFLEVRDPASPDRLLAEVSFTVQAGALVLPRGPSSLRGKAGETLVVDVLVYGPLSEIRGLLTTVDGQLIATGSMLVASPRGGGGWPRTIGLALDIPLERLPSWARLHVLAIDREGTEVEHIDSNLALSNG
jgi:hypothetical protein